MERNIIATETSDAKRQGIFFSIESVLKHRTATVNLIFQLLTQVKSTMARIKFVLWERYRAWWGAYELNKEDPLLIDKIRAELVKRKEALRDGTTLRASKKVVEETTQPKLDEDERKVAEFERLASEGQEANSQL
jgi:hypothetical protein